MAPARKGLHLFHCYIVPLEHLSAFTEADAELLAELDLWKRSLVRMLRACRSRKVPSYECVFVETVVRIDRLPHTIIECIPLPVAHAGDVGMYVHKAISEEGEVWGTNPKVTDTRGKRLHNCIPKGFPYIHFEWDRTNERTSSASGRGDTAATPAVGGLAHVIEDDKRFKRDFGRQVIGGILGLDKLQLKGGAEDRSELTERVKKFRGFFSPGYDWTQYLE